jgi:hypothetical protein
MIGRVDAAAAGAAALSICVAVALAASQDRPAISGVVLCQAGPVAGATVRVPTTKLAAITDSHGQFVLLVAPGRDPVELTASASGYYIAGPVLARPGSSGIRILVTEIPARDNSEYQWISPLSNSGQPGNCQSCHSAPGGAYPQMPFDEWAEDAHGRSTQNPRFLSVYNGTDLSGAHRSPPTRFISQREYGRTALRPDARVPYFGPGFQLDFPGQAGNCAACHAPAAAVRAPYGTRPDQPIERGGITCDFCHKVSKVRIDSATGRPHPNTPGVLSFEFQRPDSQSQLFLGPFDDAAPGHDSYSGLQNESAFCAPCHFGQFWGVQIYDSFGEWLDSPYSRGPQARTCQDCHMPRRGTNLCARVEKGGRRRAADTIYSHLMLGTGDAAFMREAIRLDVTARIDGDLLRVIATVTNEKAGHSLPTDHPGRNILLVVAAKDASGADIPLLRGPVVPQWGGSGADATDYAGRPGRGFARILEERWTGISPTIAYWNPTVAREDTRIRALASDRSEYEFPMGRNSAVRVSARLVYRRGFRDLTGWKNWQDADLCLGEQVVTVSAK